MSPLPQPDGGPAIPPDRAYDPLAYHQLADPIGTWTATARRQRHKDAVLIPRLARALAPGRVLELGSGVGQHAQALQALGFTVVASDYQPFFVEHQRAQGLEAYRVDATDIASAGLGRFDSVFCHSITPFITRDHGVVGQTYRSVHAALKPGGRLVMVNGMERWRAVAAEMAIHKRLALQAGFSQVTAVRNQLLPSRAYAPPFTTVAGWAESLLGQRFGSRFVIIATA